jgi:uncharacterized RDD family membrane protein YckC
MGEGPELNPFAPPAEYADFPVLAGGDEWRLATYGQRFAGAVIDSLLLGIAMIPGGMIMAAIDKASSDFDLALLAIFLGPLVLSVFQWIMTARSGKTLGKLMLRTRVVRDGLGTPPGFVYGVLLRSWLFAVAGAVMSCLGLADAIAIFFGNRRQTLHDRVAQTIVIRE